MSRASTPGDVSQATTMEAARTLTPEDPPASPPLSDSPAPPPPPPLDPVTKAMSAVHEHIQATKLKVSQIFSDLDSSGDGVLDAPEFRAGIRKILDKAAFTLDADMIKAMFKKVDQDRGGSIDWKEFLKAIREADLKRVAAVKARRDAANAKMLPKKKKKKSKKTKFTNWRNNRRQIQEGSPHILRWMQDAAHLPLDSEALPRGLPARRGYISRYQFEKKKSLLKRAVASLPALRQNAATSCLVLDKGRGMQVKMTFPGEAHLGGSVSGYLSVDALGKNSLQFDHHEHAEDGASSSTNATGRSTFDDGDSSSDTEVQGTHMNATAFTATAATTTISMTAHAANNNATPETISLPAIRIKGAGLRTGALAGAVGSYFALSSNKLESSDSGVQFHTEKRAVLSNVQIMDLEGNRMSGTAFRRLLEPHSCLSHVRAINLKGNDLGPTGAIALAQACVIRPSKSLLYSNKPDKTRHLRSLRLGGNRIGDTGTKVLCEALCVCKQLETLDLASNDIGSKGGTAIGVLLGKSPRLTEVDLSRNCIRGGGAAALAFGLAKSKSLLWCDISFNSFNNQVRFSVGLRALPCLHPPVQ